MKKWIAIILAGIMAFSLAACSGSSGSSDEAATSLAKIDNSKWLYNAAADVYYQTGISYCETPADESAQDYIDALNMNGEWVTYDADTNTATITSIADYVSALKNASKSLGAFDQLDSGQGENTLFGYGDGNGAHFDQTLAEILNELGSNYTSAYEEDLEKTDSAGNTASTRLDMYTPLYYLLKSEDGYNTSAVAKYWRIRTGINQRDCALSTEMDLALALEKCDQVSDVDFETVWGQGHTMAERTGSSTENFITWINTCMGRI